MVGEEAQADLDAEAKLRVGGICVPQRWQWRFQEVAVAVAAPQRGVPVDGYVMALMCSRYTQPCGRMKGCCVSNSTCK